MSGQPPALRIPVDALVRGEVGATGVTGEARVYHVSPWGWVAGIDPQGRQTIIMEPEVIGPPRPEKLRVDIPDRLRNR